MYSMLCKIEFYFIFTTVFPGIIHHCSVRPCGKMHYHLPNVYAVDLYDLANPVRAIDNCIGNLDLKLVKNILDFLKPLFPSFYLTFLLQINTIDSKA